jgi:intron-binding protein aquarius
MQNACIWPQTDPTKNVFDAEVVKSIYLKDIGPEASSEGGGSTQRLQLLEFSSYLESYLWPHFDAASASKEHLLSLVMVINQKYKDGVRQRAGVV